MPTTRLVTYGELIDHLVDFVEGDPSATVQRDARRAIQNGLDVFANEHPWTLYYESGRLVTVAPYGTGTVEYDHTGGTYERMLTLTDGTWPSWATYGYVVLNNVEYQIAERISGSILMLSLHGNPGDDVAAGATYSLRRDSYPLPADFIAADEFINVSQVLGMEYVHPRWWLQRQRLTISPGFPTIYTFMGDPNYLGTLAARFYPPPDAAYSLDFLYRRRPRPMTIDEESNGKVSIAISGTAVTGSGTVFADRHAGCIMRFGSASAMPEPISGASPFAYERVVTSVTSATGLTLDSSIPETLTSVYYTISDPLDIEAGAMRVAFLRCIEMEMGRARNMKGVDAMEAAYQRALNLAKEADSRSFARRGAGPGARAYRRLIYMPGGPDVG